MFLVTDGENEDYRVLAAFLTEDEAKTFLAALPPEDPPRVEEIGAAKGYVPGLRPYSVYIRKGTITIRWTYSLLSPEFTWCDTSSPGHWIWRGWAKDEADALALAMARASEP